MKKKTLLEFEKELRIKILLFKMIEGGLLPIKITVK